MPKKKKTNKNKTTKNNKTNKQENKEGTQILFLVILNNKY